MHNKPIQLNDGTMYTPSGPDYITEYRKRFGHRVPLVASRDYPNLDEVLKAALKANEPIKEFAEYPHKMEGDYFIDQNS